MPSVTIYEINVMLLKLYASNVYVNKFSFYTELVNYGPVASVVLFRGWGVVMIYILCVMFEHFQAVMYLVYSLIDMCVNIVIS